MRTIEFALVFFGLPALFAFTRHRIPALPALWLFFAVCLVALLRDPSFDRRQLWNAAAIRGRALSILVPFVVAAVVLLLAVRHFAPGLFLSLPRTNPILWAAIMVLYPVLSVYPQTIIYRAFLFHRYRPLFGGGLGVAIASAVAFGFLHVVFRNGWAIGLSALAGGLFAWRYLQTGSVFVSAFEHALYGCLIFTAGLGRFFYHGAVRRF
ncbi:MAG TPA: CPBP family intramembrane glutamic endopeptidase [Bryobacteraceae bacterium]|nr:CPBP family intramembrane glutamic endopeptidase [Bryobacteraceae bacterium]